MEIDVATSPLITLYLYLDLQWKSSIWKRERKVQEKQFRIGKYKGWDSLIMLGAFYRSLTNLIRQPLTSN